MHVRTRPDQADGREAAATGGGGQQWAVAVDGGTRRWHRGHTRCVAGAFHSREKPHARSAWQRGPPLRPTTSVQRPCPALACSPPRLPPSLAVGFAAVRDDE
ncbi:hypothetical protein R5R35_001311 [Gryllus longicercus]|uniref:Uncharacterized protein n=1 Tax=Gryllus longicercus TaxID=2509291 RepID=A0AAN9ZA94_9ORTH